jgi:hypothetical protein
MQKTDFIVPIHNLHKRGYQRLRYLCHSLSLQKDSIGKVFIPDSSDDSGYGMASKMVDKFPFVNHFKVNNTEFNKPILINEALKMATSDYMFITDCDYIFSKDLLNHCEKHRSDKSILFKKVLELPRMNITTDLINSWKFNRKNKNHWGTLANGAMQYATKDFFIDVINSYPSYLDMKGWGAMDNIMAYMAKVKGFDIKWVKEGEILHQFHKVEKFTKNVDKRNFDNNQKILREFCDQFELKQTLLTKDD